MINAQDYFSPQEFAPKEQLPFAQFLNTNDYYGLAIKEESAKLMQCDFEKIKGWKKITTKLGRGADRTDETLWVNPQPRIVVLNGADALSSTDKTYVRPIFMHDTETNVKELLYSNKKKYVENKKRYVLFRPIYFLIIDDNNRIASTTGVLNLKKKAHYTVTDTIEKLWKPSLMGEYKKIGFEFPAGQLPTALFIAHNIFEPIFSQVEVWNESHTESSMGCVCEEFKPIDFKRVAIARSHPDSETINQYVLNTKQHIKDVLKKPVVEETPQPQPEVDIEALTDPETGEVILPEEVLNSIPF